MSDLGSSPDNASVVDVHWFNTVEFVDKLNVSSLTPGRHNMLKSRQKINFFIINQIKQIKLLQLPTQIHRAQADGFQLSRTI